MKMQLFSEDKHMNNYTYILECSDGTFYTGWTNNLKRRLFDHNSGKGAKYTRGRLPVTLIYYEQFTSKEAAMSRECHIKKLKKSQKLLLKKSIEASQLQKYTSV